MRTIWKYAIDIADEQTITMPQGAAILHLDLREGVPCLWVLIPDVQAPETRRCFYTYGTEQPLDDRPLGVYIGTYQHWPFVWHVFEKEQ